MKSIKRNFVYNVLLKVSAVLFPLITAPYISRVLEPDGVGLVNFVRTYAEYFAVVAVLGIPQYGIRLIARDRDDKDLLSRDVSELISLSLFLTIFITIVYLISVGLIQKLNENYIYFIISGIVLYLAPFKVEWFYSGMEEYGFITLRSLIMRTLSILALFLFVKTKADLIVYLLISAASTVITDIWNFCRMFRMGVKPRIVISGLKKHLRPLLVLFSASIAISVYTMLDSLMLGFLSDYSELGFYSNASHLSRALLAVVTSMATVAMPRMSYYSASGNTSAMNSLATRSFSFVSFIAIPMAMGIVCISPTFVPLFFGSQFTPAVLPLQIICFIIVAVGLNNITGTQILIALGFDNQFLYMVLYGTVTNFILNLLLIPVWGATGAAIASVVAEFVVLLVSFIYVKRLTSIAVKCIKDVLKSLIGALAFIPLLLGLQKIVSGWWLIVLFIPLGVIIYLLLEYILKNASFINLYYTLIEYVRSKLSKNN